MLDRDALQSLVAKRNPAVETARDAHTLFHAQIDDPEGGLTTEQRANLLQELQKAVDAVSLDDISASYDDIGLEDYKALRQFKIEREIDLTRIAERARNDDKER